MMSEKENTESVVSSRSRSSSGGSRVYGFILVFNEQAEGFSHIFGVDKKVVNLGRGSKNDIRLNARMFSRLHASITITEEEEDTLKVELKNQSEQKNATRCPYVLPSQNSVILDNPSIFLLQSRRFKWMENDGDIEIEEIAGMCPNPIIYLSRNMTEKGGDGDDSDYVIVEEHSSPLQKPFSPGNKSDPGTPDPSTTPTKKRRSSQNSSLELRKAAHRRSFRSSIQQIRRSTMLQTVEEETQETSPNQSSSSSPTTVSSDLICFSPEPSTPPPRGLESLPGTPEAVDETNNGSALELDVTPPPNSTSRRSSRVKEQSQTPGEMSSPSINVLFATPQDKRRRSQRPSISQTTPKSVETQPFSPEPSTPLQSLPGTPEAVDETNNGSALELEDVPPPPNSTSRRSSRVKEQSQTPGEMSSPSINVLFATPQDKRRRSQRASISQTTSKSLEAQAFSPEPSSLQSLSGTLEAVEENKNTSALELEDVPPPPNSTSRRSSRVKEQSQTCQTPGEMSSPSINVLFATPQDKRRRSQRPSISQTTPKSVETQPFSPEPSTPLQLLSGTPEAVDENKNTSALELVDEPLTPNSTSTSRISSRVKEQSQTPGEMSSPSINVLFATPQDKRRRSQRPSISQTTPKSVETQPFSPEPSTPLQLLSGTPEAVDETNNGSALELEDVTPPPNSTSRRSSRVKEQNQTPGEMSSPSINVLFATPQDKRRRSQRASISQTTSKSVEAQAFSPEPSSLQSLPGTPEAVDKINNNNTSTLELEDVPPPPNSTSRISSSVKEQRQTPDEMSSPSINVLFATPQDKRRRSQRPSISQTTSKSVEAQVFSPEPSSLQSLSGTPEAVVEENKNTSALELVDEPLTPNSISPRSQTPGEMSSPSINVLFATPQDKRRRSQRASISQTTSKSVEAQAFSPEPSSLQSLSGTPEAVDETNNGSALELEDVTPPPNSTSRRSSRVKEQSQTPDEMSSPSINVLFATPQDKRRRSQRPSISQTTSKSVEAQAFSPEPSSLQSLSGTPEAVDETNNGSALELEDVTPPPNSTSRRSSRVKEQSQTPDEMSSPSINVLFATPQDKRRRSQRPSISQTTSKSVEAQAFSPEPSSLQSLSGTPEAVDETNNGSALELEDVTPPPNSTSRRSSRVKEQNQTPGEMSSPSINVLFATPQDKRRRSQRPSISQTTSKSVEAQPFSPEPSSLQSLSGTPEAVDENKNTSALELVDEPLAPNSTSRRSSRVKEQNQTPGEMSSPSINVLFATPQDKRRRSQRPSISQTTSKSVEAQAFSPEPSSLQSLSGTPEAVDETNNGSALELEDVTPPPNSTSRRSSRVKEQNQTPGEMSSPSINVLFATPQDKRRRSQMASISQTTSKSVDVEAQAFSPEPSSLQSLSGTPEAVDENKNTSALELEDVPPPPNSTSRRSSRVKEQSQTPGEMSSPSINVLFATPQDKRRWSQRASISQTTSKSVDVEAQAFSPEPSSLPSLSGTPEAVDENKNTTALELVDEPVTPNSTSRRSSKVKAKQDSEGNNANVEEQEQSNSPLLNEAGQVSMSPTEVAAAAPNMEAAQIPDTINSVDQPSSPKKRIGIRIRKDYGKSNVQKAVRATRSRTVLTRTQIAATPELPNSEPENVSSPRKTRKRNKKDDEDTEVEVEQQPRRATRAKAVSKRQNEFLISEKTPEVANSEVTDLTSPQIKRRSKMTKSKPKKRVRIREVDGVSDSGTETDVQQEVRATRSRTRTEIPATTEITNSKPKKGRNKTKKEDENTEVEEQPSPVQAVSRTQNAATPEMGNSEVTNLPSTQTKRRRNKKADEHKEVVESQPRVTRMKAFSRRQIAATPELTNSEVTNLPSSSSQKKGRRNKKGDEDKEVFESQPRVTITRLKVVSTRTQIAATATPELTNSEETNSPPPQKKRRRNKKDDENTEVESQPRVTRVKAVSRTQNAATPEMTNSEEKNLPSSSSQTKRRRNKKVDEDEEKEVESQPMVKRLKAVSTRSQIAATPEMGNSEVTNLPSTQKKGRRNEKKVEKQPRVTRMRAVTQRQIAATPEMANSEVNNLPSSQKKGRRNKKDDEVAEVEVEEQPRARRVKAVSQTQNAATPEMANSEVNNLPTSQTRRRRNKKGDEDTEVEKQPAVTRVKAVSRRQVAVTPDLMNSEEVQNELRGTRSKARAEIPTTKEIANSKKNVEDTEDQKQRKVKRKKAEPRTPIAETPELTNSEAVPVVRMTRARRAKQ